jgi:hypothetical protein
MEHIWTILCNSTSVDRDTNMLSIFNILEQIRFSGEFPLEETQRILLNIPFQVVTLWEPSGDNETEVSKAKLCFISPKGEMLSEEEYDVVFEQSQKFRRIIRMFGIPYVENGTYHFEVRVSDGITWKAVASTPLELIKE